MPKRVQSKRTKGWRMPAGAIYVGRPTKWDNPYGVNYYDIRDYNDRPAPKDVQDREARLMAVLDYEYWIDIGLAPYTKEDIKRELRGKTLCCWCPLDKPCHADILLRIANE